MSLPPATQHKRQETFPSFSHSTMTSTSKTTTTASSHHDNNNKISSIFLGTFNVNGSQVTQPDCQK
eukprot:9631804-Ditylum_brightwellii.AAC.1